MLIQTSKSDELMCKSVTRNTTAIATGKTGYFMTAVLCKFLSKSITAAILQTVSHGNNFTHTSVCGAMFNGATQPVKYGATLPVKYSATQPV